MGTILTLVLTSVFIFVFKVLDIYQKEKTIKILTKVLAILYFFIVWFKIFLPDGFILSVGNDIERLKALPIHHAVLRMLNAVSIVIVPLSIFTDQKLFKKILIYFCVPVTILSTFSYSTYLSYYQSEVGRGLAAFEWSSTAFQHFLRNPIFRGSYLILEWVLVITLGLQMLFNREYHFEKIKLKETLIFLGVVLFLIFQMMPIYIPQVLCRGYSSIMFSEISWAHLGWLIYIAFKIIAFYYLFQKRDLNTRYQVVLLLALAVFFQYQSMFSLTITIKRLPLQLCNLAAYFMLIALVFHKRRLFNFNFLINVVGAFFAIVVVDVNNNPLLEVWNLHYIYEHTNVFVVPILCLLFHIFPPIDKKSYQDAMIGFTIYFLVMMSVGTVLNGLANYLEHSSLSVNYLFMFDKDVMLRLIPAFSFLVQVKISVFHTSLYPFLILFIFCGYSLIVTLFFLPFYLTTKKKGQKEKEIKRA